MSLSSEQAEILFDKFNELNKKIAMLFPNIDEDYLPELKHNCCKADSDSAVVVLPSGRIIKCEETLDKHSIGSIYEGITDTDECKAMKERVSLPACEHCILYPSCIRLKQCEKGSTCSDEVVSLRIAYAKRIMQFLYGKYQSEKESSDESARVPNC